MQPLYSLSVRTAWVEARKNSIIRNAEAVLQEEGARLSFDPGPHVYTDLETGFVPACVSDVVETWCSFDSEAKATEISARDFHKKGAKYYGMTKEDILRQWNENADKAADKGTVLHSFAEACFCVATGQPEKVDPEWRSRVSEDGTRIDAYSIEEAGIMQAFQWMPDYLVPVVKECRLYNDELGYAGTVDLLCYDMKENFFVLLDWKTNESLDKGFSSKMKGAFSRLRDVPLNHYKIQQSLYQIRLRKLGFDIRRRYLLHIDYHGIFMPVPIEEYMDLLTKLLLERKSQGLSADGKPLQTQK